MRRTFSDLLLLVAVTDLHESGDDEVGEYLEHLLGALEDDLEDGLFEGDELQDCRDFRESLLDQMEQESPDRDTILEWMFEFETLLPESMIGLSDRLDTFDQLLEQVFEEDQVEEVDRLGRFFHCLDLLESQEWKDRSEAARGLATLEEEIFVLRDDYQAVPLELPECDSHSVITHIHLLEAFEAWQKAFRSAHQGDFDEAADHAQEGTGLFTAIERWTESEKAASAPTGP